MQVLRDVASIESVLDNELRALIDRCMQDLAEFVDYEMHELAFFIIVEPGDLVADLETTLCCPVWPTRSYEAIFEHTGWYEMVFILSDDGFGAEVFIPKRTDIDADLLALCVAHAIPASKEPSS